MKEAESYENSGIFKVVLNNLEVVVMSFPLKKTTVMGGWVAGWVAGKGGNKANLSLSLS